MIDNMCLIIKILNVFNYFIMSFKYGFGWLIFKFIGKNGKYILLNFICFRLIILYRFRKSNKLILYFFM